MSFFDSSKSVETRLLELKRSFIVFGSLAVILYFFIFGVIILALQLPVLGIGINIGGYLVMKCSFGIFIIGFISTIVLVNYVYDYYKRRITTRNTGAESIDLGILERSLK